MRGESRPNRRQARMADGDYDDYDDMDYSAMTRRTVSRRQGQPRRATPRRDTSRYERGERYEREERRPTERRGPSSNRDARAAAPQKKEPARISLMAAALVWVASVVLAVIVTRSMVLAGVDNKAAESPAPTAASAAQDSSQNSSAVANGQAGASEGVEGSAGGTASSSSSSKRTTDGATKNATTKGVKSPWTESGTFTTGDATLDEEVKEFCDGIATSDMDIDTAALEVYKGVSWSKYVERDDAQHPSGKNWRIQFARQYYENGCSGNCYEFAPFLGYCLQYLGFEDAHGEAVFIELKSGDWGDHGLVFVTNTDGRSCLCDTSLGTNGWMLDDTSYNYEIQDLENA